MNVEEMYFFTGIGSKTFYPSASEEVMQISTLTAGRNLPQGDLMRSSTRAGEGIDRSMSSS